MSDQNQLEPPIELGNFRLDEIIGRGGMGLVYRGEQLSPRRAVAIKIVAPNPQLPPAVLKHLKQEGETAARFDHPNLAHVYECGIVDDHYYLAMQLLPGGDLEDRIRAGMGGDEAAAIVRTLGEALDHIHDQGYVHRDIKPSNVLFSSAGSPVLVDFGIAKLAGQASELTLAGLSTGTPTYMSPEQVRGLDIDRRSDLYALGVVFYEMLTGQPPFQAASPDEIRLAHIREAVPQLPREHARYQPILDRLLAKHPADRFADCRTLRRALDDIEQKVPVPAADITAAAPLDATRADTPQTMTGQRLRFALIGVVLLTTLLGLAGWLALRPPSESDRLAAPAPVQAPKGPVGIAVMPLANWSNRPEDSYFVDGFHDQLITQLAGVSALRVISRSSVLRYRDSELPINEIASELGVDSFLQGSVQRAGEQVRITVQLIDAASDTNLWGETYDRAISVENLFAIQSEIARAVVSAMRAEFTRAEADRLARRPTDNLAAYEAYLLGRQAFNSRMAGSQAVLDEAIVHFHEALELEPEFAEALAGLASVHAVYAGYFNVRSDLEPIRKAIEFARRALALDPSLSMPHAVLGTLATDTAERVSRLERAIELEPSNSTAHLWLGMALATTGDLAAAEARLLQARRLDPLSPLLIVYSTVLAELQGDTERALVYAEDGISRELLPMQGLLSYIRYHNGDRAGAKALFHLALPPSELDAWVANVLPEAALGAGREQAIATILSPAAEPGYSHLRLMYLMALGAVDEALALIEENLPHNQDIFFYAWNADLPELRTHPDFERIARKLGLPAWWAENGYPAGCEPRPTDADPLGFVCGVGR